MSNEISRAYREASVQVRTTAEKHGVALSGRDVDKVVRSYGLERQPANVSGEKIVRAHDSLNRLNTEKDSGELLVRCQKQASVSGRSSISRTTADDIDRLQRFSRMYNRKELTAVEAEAILRSHHDLLSQPSSKISSAIVNYRSAQAFKTGSKAFLRTATLAAGMARAANSDESSGFDSQGVTAQGYDFLRKQRTGQWKKVALEKARLEAKEQAALEASAKSTGRTVAHTSPRQHSAPTSSGRGVSKVTKTRASFSKNVAKKQSHVMTSAERSYKLRRGNAVSRLVGKKKAKEAAAKAAKDSAKATLEKWAEGSSATSSIRLIAIAFGGLALVTLIVAVIAAVMTVFMGVAMAQRNNLFGDWYDSNAYKTKNFVEVTQDLQKKYYDDCIALSYEVGADAPKPEDVRINWKDVYSLWSVIVRYRAGNDRMSSVYDVEGSQVTGYSSSSPVFQLTNSNDPMFSGPGDDYLQDFYLAFYSMYYDLKAVDGRGNPILVNVAKNERYYPYYPQKDGGTGYDYSYFSSVNGFPLMGNTSKSVVNHVLEHNADGTWHIKDSAYKFIYATDRGSAEENGYFNRGKPRVGVTFESKEDVFNYPDSKADVYFTVTWTGYRLDCGSDISLNFSSGDYDGAWKLTTVVQASNDGTNHTVSGSDRETIRKALGTDVDLSSYALKNYASGTSPQSCSLCASASKKHSHIYYGIKVGQYKDLYYHKDPIKVSYQNAKLVFPSPTAQDGLKALHDVYDRVFMKGYGYNGSSYTAYTQGRSFFLGGHWTVSDDTIIEAGTTVKSGDAHEGILIVLNQIFDRSTYYPWGGATQYPRWKAGYPSTLFAYGLPLAKSGGGSHDIYDNIRTSLGYIRGSVSSIYAGTLPADNYLCASFDKTSNSNVNPYAVNTFSKDKTAYNSVIDMMGASISYVQICFPFRVRYQPAVGTSPGSDWEDGDLSGSLDKAWDVLHFSWGNVRCTWNSTTYLLYRYFMAEQSMCPAAVCGILGALQYETNFSKDGYGIVPPIDNNYAYALGLLQWNQGIKPEPNNTNLYKNRLCSWCAEHNLNWRNAGAQLQYLTDCCTNGDSAGTGNYPVGVYKCQMLEMTFSGSFGSLCYESGYTNEYGFPTFSSADCAGAYESCFYWGVWIEGGVEQWGGTYFDSIQRPGYGPSFTDKTNPVLLWDLEAYIARDKNTGAEKYSEKKLNIEKQRMVAAHVFLRYVAASDPNYYSVAYYDGDL